MKRFGVIGHPAGHSLSPLLHRSAFRLLGLDCSYDSYDVPPETLRDRVHDFKDKGFAGLNVTLPHKEAMLAVVDEMSHQAKAVGAVNTVSFFPDRITGDNTDVDGFAASIESARELFEGNSVLVLGAGGSARAILYTLLTKFRASEIVVANRTEGRARELARHFRSLQQSTVVRSAQLSVERIHRLVDHASLIVNCTPVGMFPAINESPVGEDVKFHSHQVLVDLIYTPLQTRLLSQGEKQGARTISGLEMFLHQGARSFEIWLGLHMPVDEIRPLIINELNRQRRL